MCVLYICKKWLVYFVFILKRFYSGTKRIAVELHGVRLFFVLYSTNCEIQSDILLSAENNIRTVQFG